MAERKEPWRRNESLEKLLHETNRILAPAEEVLLEKGATPRLPTLLIVGAPRSGTTLLLQWLAASGHFAYPSNLMSRFYLAPAVGARIQLLLTDERFAFRDELWDLGQSADFSSDLGKTRGALSPNEFWYFWRRFLPNEELRPLSTDEIGQIDTEGLRQELAAVEQVFEKPVAMKALILQYNLAPLTRIFPSGLVLHVCRSPLYNAQSILEAREKFFGDRTQWYSAQPPEFASLLELDPAGQVAGQVYYTNRSIEQQLEDLDARRWLRVDYESFCAEPQRVYANLRSKLGELGWELPVEYPGPPTFTHTNQRRISQAEFKALGEAWDALGADEET
jgi:hypothetical protein